jgi:cold shock protein
MVIGKRPDKTTREATSRPTEPIGTVATAQGVVKWWRNDKGYGAIGCDHLDPWDIWCHFSNIEDTAGSFRALNPGDPVEVEYVRIDQESFKYVARRVRRLASAAPTARKVQPGT